MSIRGSKSILHFISGHSGREQEISRLFTETFTASDGADEGLLIGALVDTFMQSTPASDLFVFSACVDQTLVGAIFFSRLTYSADDRTVFIMSPVAVKTQEQRKGIGEKLINHGLAHVRDKGVSVAVTYGDPNYYSKVGFRPMTEDFARAPLKLSFPHGWLGQSLTAEDLTPLQGTARCVDALNQHDLW